MNPQTLELTMLREGEERAGFERLPRDLQAMAREKVRRHEQQKLAQAAQADGLAPDAGPKVNPLSRSPLAAWAKKKRREKVAAASRRRNRK